MRGAWLFVLVLVAVAVGGAPAAAVAPPDPCGASTSVSFTNDTDVAISSAGTPTVMSTLSVAGADPYLFDVDVTTFITHTFSADLQVTVMSPAGTIVTLTSNNSLATGVSGHDNVFNGTVWDDDADPDGQVPYGDERRPRH